MTKSISAKYLGVNGAEERQKEDYYATDPNAVKDLIRKLQENNITIPHTIVESSVGGVVLLTCLRTTVTRLLRMI